MKLQKHVSRKVKNKVYTKWALTIPNKTINKLGWKHGANLKEEIANKRLVIGILSRPEEKIKFRKGSKKLSAFERLANIYSNLPLNERNLTVVFVNNQPISWEMAFNELKHRTELSKLIGEKLIKLKII